MVSNLHKEVLNSAEMCCYCRMKLPERTTIARDLRTDWWAAWWCWCLLHLRFVFVIDEKQAECTHLKRRTSLKERLPILKLSFEKSWQQFTTFCLIYLLIDFVGLAMKGGGLMSFEFQENWVSSTWYFLWITSISSITARCRMYGAAARSFCMQCTTDHSEEHVSGQFAATELCISQCAMHRKHCLWPNDPFY